MVQVKGVVQNEKKVIVGAKILPQLSSATKDLVSKILQRGTPAETPAAPFSEINS